MLAPGMHLNAVGGDCPGKTELAADVLSAARVFVEYPPQTRVEGDIQQMPADFAVTELWQVLAGQQPGRVAAEDITEFDSVGFALQDYSALRFMHVAALELGLGERSALVPEMDDPKDLMGCCGCRPRRIGIRRWRHAPRQPHDLRYSDQISRWRRIGKREQLSNLQQNA